MAVREPMRRIRRLLIANRGEIALRIIRSAQAMGLKTVAVYSQADAGAAHVAAADDALPIGPAEAARSYLSIESILAAALKSGADAIHPGYGFLSEQAPFARAVAEAGLIFVGPPAPVLAAVGDKLAARKMALELGVPLVPGAAPDSLSAARALAADIGYPVLVKAAAGGGGRGMRVARSESELEQALEAGAREATAAFGDGRVYLEKYLARPRHLEVQILADQHGRVVALGERECSVQRRHQKLIEEAPSPALDDGLRSQIAEAAIKLAARANYVNAGTIEFLLDGREFYFLEVNARLQVEHPVSELRFGCDLVAEQLKLAMGERVEQRRRPRGHAMECRVYAEDAEADFRPAAGKVLYFQQPAGPGVRVDTWLASGVEVTSFYDGLLAKVITWGEEREQARRRMARALEEFVLAGVTHTAGFLRDVVRSAPFAAGELSTRLIAEHFAAWRPAQEQVEIALVAAALARQTASSDGRGVRQDARTQPERSPWRELARFSPWSR
jgi:acetyl/propionyl-CoA carboxylase alpha subunit